ncbi:MAG: AmmeMemoRadiSam system protein B [Bacteroidota bacterium]
MKHSIFYTACLLLLLVSWQSSGQVDEGEQDAVDRQPVFAGKFYPGDESELKSTLRDFFSQAKKKEPKTNVAALIAPHAGYKFSGQVAASAYNQLDPERRFDNIFIIAPSHRASFGGASIYNKGDYTTPLGNVDVNRELASRLVNENNVFVFNESAHSEEHSLEVQLPFLQYHLKRDFQIVPIVTGSQDQATMEKVAGALEPYFNENNLFVISTDFSHYPEYEDAVALDQTTAGAIVNNSPDELMQTLQSNAQKDISNLATSMCGWPCVYALLNITGDQNDMRVNKIQYQNSGDATGRKDRVVGYWAISFCRINNKNQNTMDFQLNEEEKKTILKIARRTLEEYIRNAQIPEFDEEEISETLKKKTGAFVTLQKDGELRGCIGRFEADKPLYELIRQMAIASATQDARFSSVTEDELDDITIEVSVLTPMEKIESVDEIEVGTHGVYVEKGGMSGTLLPQVAENFNWTKEEFLGHCARDKAGIGWEGWKDANVYKYSAIVFSEEELSS